MSRDVKSTTLDGINNGLEKGINRLRGQLQNEIRNTEQRVLNQADQNARWMIEDARRGLYENIEALEANLDSRIDDVQRSLGAKIDQNARNMRKSLRDLDQKHTQALRNLRDEIYDALDKQSEAMEEMQDEIESLADGLNTLNNNLNQLEKNVNQRFQNQQQQINTINANVKNLYDIRQQDENNKLLAAGEALALLETIRQRTPVARFAPQSMQDKVALLEQRLRSIKKNPGACSITDANNLVDEALVMEAEAVRQHLKWQAKHKLAKTMADALLRLMQENMKLKVNSIYDESQTEELQADYWTHGKYSQLEQQIKEVQKRIDSGQPDMAELDQLIAKLNQMKSQADQLREEAVNLGILSECRVAVSNDILNTMLEQGWELKGDPGFMGGEEDDDCREGTYAVLERKVTGEQLSILIMPEEQNGTTVNKIIFHRNDDRVEAEGAFQTRMEQIKREIEKSGHKLGSIKAPACGGDGKIPQLKDPQKLRRKGAAKDVDKAVNRRG